MRLVRRFVLRRLGLPDGVGVLFSAEARRRLTWALVGMVFISLAEVVAVGAVLPLVQLLTGAPTDSGLLGAVSAALGDPTRGRLGVILAVVVLVGFLLKGGLTLVFRWWMLGVIMREEIATSVGILKYYLFGPYRLHRTRHTGELIRNVNDAVSQVYSQVVVGGLGAASELITVISIFGALLVLMPGPTLVVVAYFGVAALIFQRFARPRMARSGVAMMRSSVDIYRAAMNALGGYKQVKLRGTQDFFLDAFRGARTEAAEARRVSAFLGEMPKHVMEMVFILGIGVMASMVFATSNSGAALSTIALFAAAGFRVLPSIVRSLASLNAVRAGRAALELVLADLWAAREFVHTERERPDGRRLARGIEVRDLTFRYPDSSRDVVSSVDFDVPVGTSVALVGGSGAGKSTLVDLLLGLHDPVRGSIRVDQEDIHDDLARWQATIGLVSQEVFLTDGSLRENVAFGERPEEIDEPELLSAIHRAQLDDLVDSLPEGIDTPVGERGTRLSGGQRQRVGIARALYRRPAVLVLDEATSALDNETERRITDTITALHGDVTMLIVAHRLSTVRHCDQIVYLSGGRVAAAGTFEEVVAREPEFARQVELGRMDISS